MELFDALPSVVDGGACVPGRWSDSPVLGGFGSLGEIVAALGRLDSESDAVISELLARPLDDDLVAPVLLAGLRRLLFLCRGTRRELLDDLVGEVAIVIGELRRVRPLSHRRRLGYVIVDRARDRQRAALKREGGWRSIDPLDVADRLLTEATAVEDEALGRVRLGDLRDQVAASGDRGLCRSWNSLVDLVDAPRSARVDQYRWKYVRRRLLDHLGPDAA